MAALNKAPNHPHNRRRSASDPFSDPLPQQSVPLPPPKSNLKKMTTATTSSPHAADTVHDTVTTRDTPRKKVGRGQTSGVSGTRQTLPPRSQSQDSVLQAAAAVERAKTSGKKKKGSQHADVIDRLDFTGVGPMFHHDGPFDACAPSRNRHRTKAPMLAWSAAHPNDAAALAGTNDSPYPTPDIYKNAFSSNYDERSKKKVDAIAEAWGIHEPEPFEEFFAGGGRGEGDTPASSIYADKDGHSNSGAKNGASNGRRPKDGREMREVQIDDEAQGESRPARRNRRNLPPPQPIFVPDASEPLPTGEESLPSPPLGSPKRAKSIMHRIRKMRDAPNVPVAMDVIPPVSPNPTSENTRPTHKSRNSSTARTKDVSQPSEPFVVVDVKEKETLKDLPATPLDTGNVDTSVENGQTGYFDGTASSPPSSDKLGRRTSLLKKVRGVVRGTK